MCGDKRIIRLSKQPRLERSLSIATIFEVGLSVGTTQRVVSTSCVEFSFFLAFFAPHILESGSNHSIF